MSKGQVRNKTKFWTQANLLREVRYKKTLTLRKVATATGVQPTRYFRLENGYSEITASEVFNIEQGLNVALFDSAKMSEHVREVREARL
jgi:transcriptional regulator with XRE-family HTH domain